MNKPLDLGGEMTTEEDPPDTPNMLLGRISVGGCVIIKQEERIHPASLYYHNEWLTKQKLLSETAAPVSICASADPTTK